MKVYYESIKRELKRRLIYEYRYDERLKTKSEESRRLADTKSEESTRLTDTKSEESTCLAEVELGPSQFITVRWGHIINSWRYF